MPKYHIGQHVMVDLNAEALIDVGPCWTQGKIMEIDCIPVGKCCRVRYEDDTEDSGYGERWYPESMLRNFEDAYERDLEDGYIF